MLAALAGEPDLLFHLISYLPLSSVTRLLAVCRQLNGFFVEHQRRIRCLILDIRFHLRLGRSSVDLSTESSQYGEQETFIFDVGGNYYSDSPPRFALVYEISEQMSLYKSRSDEKEFMISTGGQLNADALKAVFDYLLGGFRFTCLKSDFYLQDDARCCFIDWLLSEGSPIIELNFSNTWPHGERLKEICKILDVRKLELSWNSNGRPETFFFSKEFFYDLPNICEFRAPYAKCNIGEAALRRLDCLKIRGDEHSPSINAILAWILRKLEDGHFGDFLNVQAHLVGASADLRKTLLRMNFPCVKKQLHTLFRGFDGRWLLLKSFDDRTIAIEMCASYSDCFGLPRSPVLCRELSCSAVRISIKIDGFRETIELSSFNNHSDVFSFTITFKRPMGELLLVDSWKDGKFRVYEDTFNEYTVFVDSDAVEDIYEALAELGIRLSHWQNLNLCRCTDGEANDALRILSTLHQNPKCTLQVEELEFCTKSAPRESLLLEVVKAFHFSSINRTESDRSDENKVEPWVLSSKFFDETPFLTKLNLDSAKKKAMHVLSINDETLQRFEMLHAQNALSLVTVAGYRNWINKHLQKRAERGEILLAAPKFDNISRDLGKYFGAMVRGLKGDGPWFETNFVAETTRTRRKVHVLMMDDSVQLRCFRTGPDSDGYDSDFDFDDDDATSSEDDDESSYEVEESSDEDEASDED